MKYPLFISCPKGLEYLLEEEVRALGLHISQITPQGVYGETQDLAQVYHLCLWSRLANRVQLILFNGQAHNQQTLYTLCNQFPWQTVFTPDKTLGIEFHGTSKNFRNSMFGAQVIKDGIVDHFRQFKGLRPNIDKEQPQIKLHAYLKHDMVTVSFDLTGYSMHQRGYRRQAGAAPLKENIAAAMLMRANWPELATKGYALHDPFCGAGTLVIEAAMMASHIAPGLLRQDQSLIHWAQHQSSLWEKVRSLALKQVKAFPVKLVGTDNNPKLIEIAHSNAEKAGVLPLVEFSIGTIQNCKPSSKTGLLIANPPYGERLGDVMAHVPLYQQIGTTLHTHYQGWQAAILTSNPLLAKALGLRSDKQYTLYNGPLECKLYRFVLNLSNQLKTSSNPKSSLDSGIQMLVNRLKKNYSYLQKWIKRNNIYAYRVYDADLPEYAYAIDIYNEQAVLQEYAAPARIPAHKAEKRSLELIQAVPIALGIPSNNLIVKQRKRQRGEQQYQKLSDTKHRIIVKEGPAKFKVNLVDYLDTGIFLDQRTLRLNFGKLAPGKQFLNCFCYTGTASVHAALAGATTTNIDLSNTYLNWAKDNFQLNQLDLQKHQFIQEDVSNWLRITRNKFDVIFLAPPSFSNSKRMDETFDLQRDHERLIHTCMRLLTEDGILYFSTHLKKFTLSPTLKEKYSIKEITHELVDLDFKRSKSTQVCFKLSRRTG